MTAVTPPRAVAAATLLSFALRLWLAARIPSPFLFHDEGSYVAVGRALLGEAPELFGPRYAPGYGVLLAPAQALLDPGGVHLAAKVLNAAALAALVPVAYVLARRLGGLGPWLSLGVALAGSAGAGLVVQATMLLPEALLALATAGTVVLLHRWLERPGALAGLAAGSTAGFTYALHTRGAAVVGAVAVVAVAATALRRVDARQGGVVLGATVAVAAAGHLVGSWATERLYPLATRGKEAGDLLEVFDDPLGVARTGAGHVWYLVFATGGLAALGAVAAARTAWVCRRAGDGLAAGAVVLGLGASVLLSALVHEGVAAGVVDRPDKLVYGRYLQQWAPVLVALAPSLVVRWSRRAALVAVGATGAGSLAVAALLDRSYDADVWSGPVAWHNVATLWLVDDVFGALWVVRTAVAFGVVVVVVLGAVVASGRPAAWAAPLVLVGLTGVIAGHKVTSDWAAPASRAWAASHEVGPVLERLDRPVAVDVTAPTELFHALNLQLWHPGVDVDLRFGEPTGPVALRIDALADGPPTGGSRLVAVEQRLALGLWAVDPAVVRELRDAGVTFLEPPAAP